jgi:hypothetical protein
METSVSEFEEASRPSEFDATRATARLPGLDIEIIHRRAPAGDAEQISINLQAAPSFEAFGRFLETANPFAFWMAAAQLAWSPWLEAARVMLPASAGRPLPSAHGRSSDRDAPR